MLASTPTPTPYLTYDAQHTKPKDIFATIPAQTPACTSTEDFLHLSEPRMTGVRGATSFAVPARFRNHFRLPSVSAESLWPEVSTPDWDEWNTFWRELACPEFA